MHPVLVNYVKKAVAGWPPRAPNSVTGEGMKRMSGRLLITLSKYFSGSVS
jgi:hypothetical protein